MSDHSPSPSSPYPVASRARAFRSSEVRDLLRRAQMPGVLSLAGGLPAAELFDRDGLARAIDDVLQAAPAAALQYGVTEGQAPLREAIAQRHASEGVDLAGRAVVVTSGSQQALDLMARVLLDEGDTVVVERPTYLAALQAFRLCGARLATIAGDAEGAAIEELEAMRFAAKPKLVYVVSNFGNPSGRCLSLERRLRLLRWAARERVFVLEDDPYGALRTDGEAIPSLLALAQRVPGAAAWCGLTSTLSKTVAPGLRVGWLVLPDALAEVAVRLKQAFDLHTSSLVQEAAAAYLRSGRLAPQLDRLRACYRERRRTLADALGAAFGPTLRFEEPDGGMFLWARFADGTDTRELLAAALEEGVAFVPGDAFFADRPERGTLRLNFTASTPADLVEAVARLARAHAALGRGRGAVAA